MIDHLELQSRQIAETVCFYEDVLGPLGYSLQLDGAAKGFGTGEGMDLFIVDGEPSANVHFAFSAGSRAAVDTAFATGRDKGHSTDRPPALAPNIHPNYYAAYLKDPDGRLVEIVCQRPE